MVPLEHEEFEAGSKTIEYVSPVTKYRLNKTIWAMVILNIAVHAKNGYGQKYLPRDVYITS